jgi:hypothetical protein
MSKKAHKGQGAVWVILIIAIIALIAIWISKNPINSTSTTAPENNSVLTPTATPTSITPSQSLDEIEKDLKTLNNTATDIDKGLNDTQIDVN